MAEQEKWDLVIRPRERLLSVDFKVIWRYRDLCSLLVKRNIITQYKQTILGPAWYVPQPLFYLAGTCLWQYYSDCLTKTSNTFVDNAGIFGKVYFPRLVVPLANVISNLLRFAIQFGLFALVYVAYAIFDPACGAHLTLHVLLFPLLVFMIAGLAMGFGTIISSMTTKYRDLQILFSFLVTLWMYATPIVYPLSQTAGKQVLGISLHTLMCLNPVTAIIETFKYGFLGAGEFIGWGWLGYSFGFMLLTLLFGILIFNKVQKNFMDTV